MLKKRAVFKPLLFLFIAALLTETILDDKIDMIFLARVQAKAPELAEFPNPALKRKSLAGYRNHIRWLAVSGCLILVTGALLGVGYVESNKKVKLSPAVPVQAQSDIITIPVNQISDTKRHRFSYLTKDNVTMRFIVMDKGNGLFGLGLDALK